MAAQEAADRVELGAGAVALEARAHEGMHHALRAAILGPDAGGHEPLGIIEKHPLLTAWRNALMAAPAVKASTVANIEAVWQENLIIRGRWLSKFVPQSVVGAAAAA